jgi:hypothetical protein
LSVLALPIPVAPGVLAEKAGPYTNRNAPQFALSPSGTLVYAASDTSALNVVLEWHEELRRLVPPPQPPLPR